MPSWPDRPAAATPGTTVRAQLDYLAWIGEAAEAARLHDGPELEAWRHRVNKAFVSLVDSMVSEHGDPLPPDVPPSVQPGLWPDVPAVAIQGMTVRHQLTVIRTVAGNCRGHSNVHHQPGDSEAWAARVQAARDAADHGVAMPMPDSARSAAPALPASKAKKTAPSPKSPKRGSAKKPKRASSGSSRPHRAKAKRAKPKPRRPSKGR